MLDGLLGRTGFYSKCKSLIKQTKTRIDVAKRKRNATQKFMKKDIADLLANGLETNADARTERLILDLILVSCYDFIDDACEIILKNLPVLQKLRECPEDCREAVASLMFAAARFSDLPELRELRDLFQERYGSSLEYYVNQKLVENITPKPPSTKKKAQLMQEIALDFSIQWDGRFFEERMSKPSTTEKNQRHSPGTLHAVEKKVLTPFVEGTVRSTIKDEVLATNRTDAYQQKERHPTIGHLMEKAREGTTGRRDNLKHDEHNADIQVRSMRKRQEDGAGRPKSDFRNAIPPPYVKPRKSKHKSDLGSRQEKASKSEISDGVTSTENEDVQVRLTEIYYKDASSGEFIPRRRSHRRKHSRSMSSSQDDKMGGEEERVMRRVSTSRRKHESRKGLQILFDDEHYKEVNKEERIIDKLLLHYSKKPSSVDHPGKPRTKTNSEMKVAIKSPHNKTPDGTKVDRVSSSTPTTSRSMSFPSRKQVNVPDPEKKVFARASSFHQESPAKHVHPKLPNYDDLATRFTALRVCKS